MFTIYLSSDCISSSSLSLKALSSVSVKKITPVISDVLKNISVYTAFTYFLVYHYIVYVCHDFCLRMFH